jgi:uncharacterized protein (DUF885 family)
MRKLIAQSVFLLSLASPAAAQKAAAGRDEGLAILINNYYNESLRLYPINATLDGDNRFNDRLNIDFTDSFRNAERKIYMDFTRQLTGIRRNLLSAPDRIDYDVIRRELLINLEGLSFKTNLMPFNQMNSLPATFSLLGSGAVGQPFRTVRDYDNWLKRASVFPAWCDSAIVYFRRGLATHYVLPAPLVTKMIAQVKALAPDDPTKSTFYTPVSKLPASFSEADRARFRTAYTKLITDAITPAYGRLRDFLEKEYLPRARSSSGIGDLPDGKRRYAFAIRYYTTVSMPADSVFNLGLSEVARIRSEMEAVKKQVGFTGTLNEFFERMRTEPRVYPFKTEAEILNYYRSIQQRINPALKKMFTHVPQTPFEVRAIEPFRVASTPAHYFAGSLENGRPGIFYVPIIDATKTQARESLFLHEAIPGHHYQISLQNENKNLSKFRQHNINSGFAEGWGLYAESLGKELGLYTDPYQHMLALGDEIHRAIRLVVDAGIHSKGWTREQAIKYSLGNEPIETQRAESEIERYMADPGQALSYKIGELKIKQMRARYEKQLGAKFNLAAFHDALLEEGCLPLDVLERKMDEWAKKM